MSIPKQAFFVYGEHHTNPMPDQGLANIEDFKRLNPGWNVLLITVENSNQEHRAIYDWNKLAWSQVIRYELIYKYGGLYSDVDVLFYGVLPDTEGCDLVLAVERHGGVVDAFYAAEPGHPLLKECLERSLEWCKAKMDGGVTDFTTEDMFLGCGVILFSETSKKHTGMEFVYEKQVHMTEADFGGKFHPENGVGILPFEALCRHNTANWFGWHQCWGSWRPRTSDDKADMRMDAWIKTNG